LRETGCDTERVTLIALCAAVEHTIGNRTLPWRDLNATPTMEKHFHSIYCSIK
jgi:hypothetical protein